MHAGDAAGQGGHGQHADGGDQGDHQQHLQQGHAALADARARGPRLRRGLISSPSSGGGTVPRTHHRLPTSLGPDLPGVFTAGLSCS
ncbi:hypothetical protein [Lysobacter gummosus]|uniref:hypothetical protein n=1 Tax=Lysobacter gummosus TaxID=262324 RepID=UPI003631E3CE